MMKSIAILTSVILAVSMFACIDEPASDHESTALLPEPQPSNAANTPSDSAEVTSEVPPTSTAGNGCSIVEWCNEPGSNGTVCRQVACDLATARQECSREAVQICGTVVQPFIIVCKNATCT